MLLCQACGEANSEELEFCRRCHQRLLVVSGPEAEEELEDEREESFSLDEHLLERISVLEEAVKRTNESVRQLLAALRKQERSLLINYAGLETARELLEEKGLVDGDDWGELWEAKMNFQFLAVEKRDRFLASKDRIVALHSGSHRSEFLSLIEDAEYALFGFEVAEAVARLEEAHKLDRSNYELAYFLGEFYFNEGEPERALLYLNRVLAVAPDHYEGLVFSGVIRHERGELAAAEEVLLRAIERYPDAFLPAFSLGAALAGQGQLARAVAFLERAVASDPVPQALFLLGRCYLEMGRVAPAIEVLKDTVRKDPGHEEAHHQLGMAYLERGFRKKALESFRAAQRLNPKKMRYQDLVGYLSGRSPALPEVGGAAREHFAQAEAFLARGQAKRAGASLRRALALEPDHPTLLLTYAVLCLTLDRTAEVEPVVQRVLDGSTDEMLRATAFATWIAALRSQGKFREGNRLGRRLLEESQSPFARTIAFYEMAYNLAEMEEDLDLALEYAQSSLALAPEELRQFPVAALGWVHSKRREHEPAVAYLSEASELDPSVTALTHLGMALLAAGEDELAKNVLGRAQRVSDRGQVLAERMMDVLKDSGRLLERLRRRQRK
jgi:tetratricopeptide (TPR) repeat protein